MFTKEQLAKWRELGFEFDDFYDQVAVDPPAKSLSIRFKNYAVVENLNIQTIKIYLEVSASNLTSQDATIYVIGKQEALPSTMVPALRKSIKKNGITQIEVAFFQDILRFDNTIELEDIYKAHVVCDGLTAESNEFKLVGKNKSSSINTITSSCGSQYKGLIKCVNYNGQYGPLYNGKTSLSSYKFFDDLITKQTISTEEKDIIVAMSENEGNLDAIQSYDSEILTAGAMQKTVNIYGYGEFPIQVWEFKMEYPKKYEELLENCKWEVREEEITNSRGVTTSIKYKMFYNNISEVALKNEVRKGFSKDSSGKQVDSLPLLPIMKLLNDKDFQAKQIEDFIDRLHSAISKKPTGYSFLISAFIRSKLGKAIVLDHDVNRPAHVSKYFGEALNKFFKENENVPKNPNEWGEEHNTYENQLLEIYGPLRGEKLGNVKYPMTDAKNRYNKLKNKL